MKSNAIFLTNDKEIESVLQRNDQLGTNESVPENVFEESEFNFRMQDVSYVYLNLTGNINICVCGQLWTLKYDKDLYDEIKKRIDDESK